MDLRALVTDTLDAWLPRACAACGAARTSPAFCGVCSAAITRAADGAPGAFVYGGPVADAIRAAKFNPDVTAARALADHWRDALAHGRCAPLPPASAVVPVPSHWWRRARRGFDLPSVFAVAVARAQGIPVVDALRAVRLDAPLSAGADKVERATRVTGRYHARTTLEGKHVIVVDDVHTSGATLQEACRVLQQAGATTTAAAFAYKP